MNLYIAGVLVIKVTLLLSVALCALPLMRRTTAQMRHLLSAIALSAALLAPLSLLIPQRAVAIRVPVVFAATATYGTVPAGGPVLSWLFILWTMGTAALFVRIGIGYWRIGRVLGVAELFDGFLPVPVYTAEVAVPIATGVIRPAILLPRSAAGWPSSQRDAALRHELTHLERKDLWTNLIAHIACAVYWFHPLVWMLASQLHREQETACDDAVLHSGFSATHYAEALVAAARHITTSPNTTLLIGCPMITLTNETSLKSRIARLLDRSTPRVSSPATLRRTAILFGALLAAIALVNAAPQARAADEKVYKMSDGITPPRVLYKIDPEYTEEARAAKVAGTVLLSVTVGADGLAHDINVVRELDGGLDVKAVEAVEKWHFQPGTMNGEPVAVRAQIEINFRLN